MCGGQGGLCAALSPQVQNYPCSDHLGGFTTILGGTPRREGLRCATGGGCRQVHIKLPLARSARRHGRRVMIAGEGGIYLRCVGWNARASSRRSQYQSSAHTFKDRWRWTWLMHKASCRWSTPPPPPFRQVWHNAA